MLVLGGGRIPEKPEDTDHAHKFYTNSIPYSRLLLTMTPCILLNRKHYTAQQYTRTCRNNSQQSSGNRRNVPQSLNLPVCSSAGLLRLVHKAEMRRHGIKPSEWGAMLLSPSPYEGHFEETKIGLKPF